MDVCDLPTVESLARLGSNGGPARNSVDMRKTATSYYAR